MYNIRLRRRHRKWAWMRAAYGFCVARQNQYVLYNNVYFGAAADMQIYVKLSVCVSVWVCSLPGPVQGHCISASQVRNKRTEP